MRRFDLLVPTGSLLIAGVVLAGGSASARTGVPVIETSVPVDGAVIAGALALVGAATLLPIDSQALWSREPVPFDDAVKLNFSSTAARTSDLLLAGSVLVPLAVQAGQGFEPDTGKRVLVYGETLALSLALNAVTKHLVGRPRPYVYNPDPRVRVYGEREAKDSRLSFYSGHAATAFAAAVSGAYLFSQSSDDTSARSAVWATGLLLAGATSNLRVRAGKHFYSDVAVGAALGVATGLAVPLLHQTGQNRNALAASEWIAIATAPIAGAVLSQLIPVASDITEPLTSPGARATTRSPRWVSPWISPGGAGLTLQRLF